LLNVVQRENETEHIAAAIGAVVSASSQRRKLFVDIVEVVQREKELFLIALTLRSAGGFAGGLHSRQQQSDQDSDDGNDHQELDEREARAVATDLNQRHGKLLLQ
jgi:hypothetical protein